MKMTGSISVTRVDNPLTDNVVDTWRNRLSKDKRTVLLRVGLNLCLKSEYLRSVETALGKVDTFTFIISKSACIRNLTTAGAIESSIDAERRSKTCEETDEA
jgi:hypothetical protein